jgi:hypothetical protein
MEALDIVDSLVAGGSLASRRAQNAAPRPVGLGTGSHGDEALVRLVAVSCLQNPTNAWYKNFDVLLTQYLIRAG